MHSVRRFAQIVDDHLGAVFAVAVGEHAVGRILRPQVNHPRSDGFHGPNRLHGHIFCCAVAHLDFDIEERALRIGAHNAHQVWLCGLSSVRNGEQASWT